MARSGSSSAAVATAVLPVEVRAPLKDFQRYHHDLGTYHELCTYLVIVTLYKSNPGQRTRDVEPRPDTSDFALLPVPLVNVLTPVPN
jgi:hypothetical protein